MKKNTNDQTKCPKCGAELSPVEETTTGKKLQRCSKGSWNRETRQTEGCDFVRWLDSEPVPLDEKCPKCGANLIMATTRNGKKLKKCSTAGWDRDNRLATGCDYIEWFNGTKEELDELCPKCNQKLLLVTTTNGKKMKKCSTSGWDREKRQATGCDFILWINVEQKSNGDENFPSFES